MLKKAQVDNFIQKLQELSDCFGVIDELEERASRAKVDLDSVNKTLADAKRELVAVETRLANSRAEAERRYQQEAFTKQGELKNLAERLDARMAQCEEVQRELKVKNG